jgi:uncharacterized membrane protein
VLGEVRPQAGLADDIPGIPAARARRTVSPASTVRLASVWRDPWTWAIVAAVFGAYCVISLVRLLRFDPSSYDLGIYVEYVKQLSQLHAPVVDILAPGFNLLGNHFQIAVAVLAPFFRVFPSPATLLVGQAALTAISVFPVAAAGTAVAGRSTGRLIGFAYGFSWGLQQLVNFDFHEIALAVPLLAFSLSAFVRRRPLAMIGWAMPLVFVEESQGFTVAAIGLLLGVSAARQDSRWGDGRWGDGRVALWGGLFLLAWGLFGSVLAVTVIVPHFNPSHGYYFWKDGGALGGSQPFSVGALLAQTAAHWQVKLETTILLLLPTAFAALGSPIALVALPSLALRFISTNSSYWGTGWHYNATVMPILFLAAVEATGRLRRSRGPRAPRALDAARLAVARYMGAMTAAIAVAIAFHFPLSELWHSSTFRPDAHAAAAKAALATVPDGVTVQATLDMLAPLAARTDTFWIGTPGNPVTQYVVFDGANSGYSPAVTDVPAFISMIYPRQHYVQIFERDEVYVFRLG